MVIGIFTGLILITILVVMFSIGFQPFLMLLLLIPVFYLVGVYRSHKPGKGKMRRNARSLEKKFFKILLKDVVVIDTAIWADETYADFFTAFSLILAAHDKKLLLFDRQYDEIMGSEQRTVEETTPTHATPDARSALKRFIDKNLITLVPDNNTENNTRTDTLFTLRALIGAGARFNNVILISNNRELIAHARKILKERKIGITINDYLEDLLPACDEYCTAVQRGIIKPLCWKGR